MVSIYPRLASWLTCDLSPEWMRTARARLATPLGLLLTAAAVAALVGMVVHVRVFALAAGLLALAASGVCWPWLTARGLRGRVAFDRPRAVEGSEVGASAIVANHLPWPAIGLVLHPEAGGVRLPRLAGRARSVCRWVFTPPRRGEYPSTLPRLGTAFPFGIWESGRPCEIENRLIVWPRTFPVGPVPVVDGDAVIDGNVTRNKVGSTGDVLGVRPYRRGDSPRRIHWAQSARHDRLIVCELQSNSRPVVMLVLDTDANVHTEGADGSFEWAVRAVASLVKGWLAAGAQVGYAAGDVVVPPQSGNDQGMRILDALARVAPAPIAIGAKLRDPRLQSDGLGVKVVVTTDAAERSTGPNWVVLDRAGFGGEPGTNRGPRPWLRLDSPATVPDRLRHGTGEASHGS
jgi:uncharacterized protein (DUF58 family)